MLELTEMVPEYDLTFLELLREYSINWTPL